MKAIVIIPTYNEKENIASLVRQLLDLPVGLEIIVVDDNSPDGTGELADALAVESGGRVQVIHRPGKLGLGTAYVAGFRQALAAGADHVLTMDADFSHNPRYIPAMLEKASRGYDLVIGSRYVPGGGASGCTAPRILLSWGANGFARTMLGLRARDTTAGFRCYRREVLESVGIDEIRSSGYSFLIEMLYRAQRRGWQVGEVPIVFDNRQLGQSKISRHEILRAQQTVLRLAWARLWGRDG
ncbi:MAG: polyprenol monophosphomannose synthase [Anaerolineae bacterium]|nr:polyprenol monophosphomannose synthase [Anaerolineae bacterium]